MFERFLAHFGTLRDHFGILQGPFWEILEAQRGDQNRQKGAFIPLHCILVPLEAQELILDRF